MAKGTPNKEKKLAVDILNVLKTLRVGGVDITSVIAELATLDGLTSSVAELNILDGVTKTAAEINLLLAGVAGGYKIARSAAPVALDGSNPTSVAHGLTTCEAVFVQLVGSSAPGDNTSVLTAVINGENIDVYAWKNTGGTDPTLVASTGTETFNWIAIGT